MYVVAIVPARMAASRFPNKPMALLCGMPMVGHCYHRTRLVPGVTEVHVATCDHEIRDFITGIGGSAIMTSDSHTRATGRTAEAIEILERRSGRMVDVALMVQGDEPLAQPEELARVLPELNDPSIAVTNLMARIRTLDDFRSPNTVKVVCDAHRNALYFSREPIPSAWRGVEDLPMFKQTGIIAFRRSALAEFARSPETRLEQIESVDMNRILENGGSIRMVPTEADPIGVDTPEDLQEAERRLLIDPIRAMYQPS